MRWGELYLHFGGWGRVRGGGELGKRKAVFSLAFLQRAVAAGISASLPEKQGEWGEQMRPFRRFMTDQNWRPSS